MTRYQKITLILMRLGLGWLLFYAGVTKLANPEWSAGGYLKGSKTLTEFYSWLAQPNVLPTVDFLNEWGLTLLGISLILGVFVRLSSILAAVLMLLYYFPVLDFPKVGAHSYIVDDHIIYALGLLVLAAFKAGRVWGLENWCANLPMCRKYPALRRLLG